MSDPMDLTPHFVLAGAEPEKIVPSEFDIGVPLPAPTPPRLRTRFDPEGQGPRQGMSFGENVLGAWRSGTLLGAASEAADIYTARRPAATGTEELQYGGEGLSAEENRQNAIDLTLDQIAYDLAPPRFTPQSVAGTLLGSAASPESFATFGVLGLSSLLVRQFPALGGAGARIVAQGIETATVNTATDPLVQGARIASGGQESYDPAQTALAPVIGFGLGAGARAVGEVPGLFRRAAPDAIEAPAVTPLDTALDDVAKSLAPEAAPEVAAPRLGLDEPPAAPVRAPEAAMPEAAPPRVEVAAPEGKAAAQNDSLNLDDVAWGLRKSDLEIGRDGGPLEVLPFRKTHDAGGRAEGVIDVARDGVVIGRAEIGVGPDSVKVHHIETVPAVRRQGAASEIMRSLRAEFPGHQIDTGIKTKDGRAFFEAEGRAASKALGNNGAAADGDLVLRRRGQQQVTALPPDQIAKGRLTDSTGANPEASPRITRLEDISRNLVDSFEAAGRTGRVMPGARGQYSTKNGMIRVRSVSDFDTIAHEVGHAFHLSPQTRPSIDPIVKANRAELMPLGAGDKAGDQEAFAELFRLYVANPRYAAQNYPKATAALDTMLRDRFPEQFAAVERIRSQLEALYLAPSGELVKADTISIPPPGLVQRGIEYISPDRDPTGKTVYSVWDRLYTAVVDKMNPVNKAVLALRDIAGRNGRAIDLKPLDDAYLLLRETAGARASASFMAKHGVIAAGDIRPIDGAPSLSTGLEKALGQAWSEPAYNDFGAYLVARRMVTEYGRFLNGEIPNPPGKLSLADYRQAVADFEAKYPTFQEGAADIYAFQRAHLQRMFDKGLYSKDFYDAAINRADYVPFVRDMADLADETAQTGGRTSAGSDLSRSVMKTFKGSERSVYDPISSIFQKIHDLEFVAARNDVVNALAKLGEAAGPGAGFIAEPIPNTQLKGQKVDVIEALRSAGKRANMDDADLGSLILQVEDALGDSTITTLFRAGEITPGGEPIVFRWEGGERRALRLADGRFGQSMYHALTAMSEPERNWFFLALQLSQQMLRAGVTRAADFVVVNFIRDQFSSMATAGRRYIPFISAVKGVHDILSGSQAAMDYAARGGFSGGAITDVIEASNLGRNVRSLDGGGVLKQMGEGNFGEGARRLLAKSAKGLEISEGATRVGLFKSFYQQAKDIGWDDANAVFYATHRARDYIDFQRSGAAMDTLRRWVPFLNAAIQGTDKETRSLANLFTLERRRSRGETLSSAEMDQLKDARVAWVRVMAMGAVLGTGTALLGSGEPEYENASRYAKDGSFLIKMGDYWLSIPKPFGAIQAIVNAFERGTEGAIRREPSLAGDWLASAASGFVPPMSNPLVTQVYDVPANYDRFRESPIVPFFLQGVKPSEQYLPGTAELAKFIGSVTNWSPLKIEYVIRNMGGSMALDFLKGTDALMGKDAPEKQIYDYPVLRRFVKNLARGSAATREFYNLVGEKNGKYEQAEGAYRQKVRDGERVGAATFLAGLPDDEKIWTTLSTSFEANEQRLHPMRNARDRVSVFNGMISQLTRNNLLEEDKIKRGGQMTLKRRDATPIPMTPEARARVIEDLQEASMLTARNAMIAVGAKGTKGLDTRSLDEQMNRIKAHSPAAYAELERRLTRAKVYDFADVAAAWPELKRRILADGEKADLKELRREAGRPSRALQR